MQTIKQYFWSFLAVTVAILLCVLPFPVFPKMNKVPLMDKWVHFVMFGGVACAVWLDKARLEKRTSQARVASGTALLACFFPAVVLPVLLGGVLELVQAYVTTYRSGDWFDFLADSIGVLLAIPLGLYVIRPFVWFRVKRAV